MQLTAEVERAIRSVKPLPQVAQRVLQVVQEPDFAIDRLVDVVRTEPTLVARVLRLCNSARHGLGVQITSLTAAVAYVGTRNLVQLVLVSCSAEWFQGVRSSAYTSPLELWQHSLTCALLCQELAERLPGVDRATAFTAGILHDIGKVALAQVDVDAALLRDAARDVDPRSAERRAFGLDHAAAAGLVGAAWQLPATLIATLRDHHDPEVVLGDDPLPALLHLADRMALRGADEPPLGASPSELDRAALAQLDLDLDTLTLARARAIEELTKASELLNLAAQHVR